MIVRWEQVRYLNWSLAPDQLGNAGSTSAFVLVREGSDFPSRAEDMAHWFKEFYWPYQYGTAKEVRIFCKSRFLLFFAKGRLAFRDRADVRRSSYLDFCGYQLY